MKIDLTGHTAVVTGASGELGRAIARGLAQCGAHVALHYFGNHEKANSLLNELQAQYDGKFIVAQADVTNAESVGRLRDSVTRELGAPDIVVNNAVSQYTWTTVLQQAPLDYESQFRTCVLHNVLMAQAFVPAMIERGWGRIIGINTECAMMNTATQSAYVAGKRGMDGVLRVLAREVGAHGITVNQVAPGWTISEKYRADNSDEARAADAAYSSSVPLGHRGQDSDIANAVAFLASDLARFITGVYLPVCGGNVMPAI
jgi:3-oxoacyl-[acyl-carrier protein] reductase